MTIKCAGIKRRLNKVQIFQDASFYRQFHDSYSDDTGQHVPAKMKSVWSDIKALECCWKCTREPTIRSNKHRSFLWFWYCLNAR